MTALHLRGVVLPDDEPRDVWVVGDRLTFEPVAAAETVVDGGWLLPGLVDAHCHVGLEQHGAVESLDVAREQARADRDSGALLLRDAGVPFDTRPLQADDEMPRLVRAGRHIARTRRYLRNFAEEIEPDSLVGEIRHQAGRGDGWVKIVGDWIDRDTGDLAPCWPGDVLRDAVAAAHEAGARVAVHAFSTEALPDLVDAGVDSVEHGCGLIPELAAEMSRRGSTLTVTTQIVETFDDIADGAAKFPSYAKRMRELRRRYAEVVTMAHEAGVALYAGTDAGGALAHGIIADELAGMAALGLPTDVVLGAGSWAARRWLGLPGLEEGAPADVVCYPADPRADIAVLRAPARIVLKGRVVA